MEHLFEKKLSLPAASKLALLGYFNIQIPRYLSSFESLIFIRSVWALLSLFWFCNVNLCFETWIFEITWHSARLELSRTGEPKCLYEKKLSRLPGLPYLPRRDNSSNPRQLGEYHINGWRNLSTLYWKVSSPRVTQGEGCLGYPRPYKRGLRKRHDFWFKLVEVSKNWYLVKSGFYCNILLENILSGSTLMNTYCRNFWT